MNGLVKTLTMTSLEIAERTGKDHFHVMRDIKLLLEKLGEGESRFGCTYQDVQGKERPMFALPKRELMILLTGYSVLLRAKVIDRWQELEERFKLDKTDWQMWRLAVKSQYKSLTNAIDDYLIKPVPDMDKKRKCLTYAIEADELNLVVFGMRAREFKKRNPALGLGVNQRDLADRETLLVLDALEEKAAAWIEAGIPRKDRRVLLIKAHAKLRIKQSIEAGEGIKALKGL